MKLSEDKCGSNKNELKYIAFAFKKAIIDFGCNGIAFEDIILTQFYLICIIGVFIMFNYLLVFKDPDKNTV